MLPESLRSKHSRACSGCRQPSPEANSNTRAENVASDHQLSKNKKRRLPAAQRTLFKNKIRPANTDRTSAIFRHFPEIKLMALIAVIDGRFVLHVTQRAVAIVRGCVRIGNSPPSSCRQRQPSDDSEYRLLLPDIRDFSYPGRDKRCRPRSGPHVCLLQKTPSAAHARRMPTRQTQSQYKEKMSRCRHGSSPFSGLNN